MTHFRLIKTICLSQNETSHSMFEDRLFILQKVIALRIKFIFIFLGNLFFISKFHHVSMYYLKKSFMQNCFQDTLENRASPQTTLL